LELLPELSELGISAVKIEGRQRSPAYVSKVAGIWREAIDRLEAAPGRFHTDPSWMAGLGEVSEGTTTTLGAYERRWK
jgi:putative protease